jgi:hypothetical protein
MVHQAAKSGYDVQSGAVASLRNERSRKAPVPGVAQGGEWTEPAARPEGGATGWPRRAARSVARVGFRVIRPVAKPIAWRMRSFLIEPVQHQDSAQHLRILAELAALGSRLSRIETLLTARDHRAEEILDEVRELLRSMHDDTGGPEA